MNTSRTKASIKNAAISIGIQFGTLFAQFIQRTFFIRFLEAEYLGVDGLFSNILSLLNMVELGFGGALDYLMYKPMANGDENKLRQLMKLYAKIYNAVGAIVLIVGFSLTPFLHFFIRETTDIPNLSFIYCLHVLNTGLSYFFVYKSSIVTAEQSQYVVNINKFIFIVIQNILQILLLHLFRDYIVFYCVTILCTLLTNISISIYSDKKYPYIKGKATDKLSQSDISEIKKYVSAVFFVKLGLVVLNGTDNIVISTFVGIETVGIYSNYLLIITALQGLIQRIFTAISASVGNLGATSAKEHSYVVFRHIYMFTGLIAGLCSICLLFLFNPFIHLWLGDQYLLSESTVLLIVINFYLATIRRPAFTFDEAFGQFPRLKYKSVFEAFTNILISIYLSKYLGINGVLLGTLISTLLFSIWIEPYVLYRYVFDVKLTCYFKMAAKLLTITFVSVLPVWLVSSQLSANDITVFFIRLVSCAIMPAPIYLIFLHKSEEFQYYKHLLASRFRKEK